MRYSFLLFFGLVCTFCERSPQIDSSQLEGYWEIEKVSSHGETFFPKGPPPLVDYYHLSDKGKGYRKKLAPRLGLYQTSEQQFSFEIEQSSSGRYQLHFMEALEPWKEMIIALDSTQLILEHQDKVYHYIPHEKIVWNE